MSDPWTWADLVPGDTPDAETFLVEVVDEIVEPLDTGDWAGLGEQLLLLVAAAQDAAQGHSRRAAAVPDIQVSLEEGLRKRHRSGLLGQEVQAQLEQAEVERRPSEWVGRKVRRREVATNNERAEAETAERTRWGREIVGLLVEAKLPFSRHAGSAPGSILETRCCRGLRFRTLRKFVRVWRQFRRYLLAHGHPVFPGNTEVVLQYLEVQAAAGAPKTWFGDFRASLRFLEESGEQAQELLLHSDPAVANAVLEASAAAAARPTAPGARRGRQAPPLPVALVAALEDVVVGDGPSYSRLYAGTRLVFHWTAMRWDDSLGVHPNLLEQRARGVIGQLDRTKTSGSDKQALTLPIFVSARAYLVEPQWLNTRLALLAERGLRV